jgi:hypothetical protein
MIRKNTKKVPQIVVVTLLSALPICYAQSALATSSFGLPLDSQLYSKQQAITTQQLNQPKNYLSSRSHTSLTPSIEDLNTLKSTLASYKTQLNTLVEQQPTNDSPQLQTAITRLQNSIQALESDITDVEKDLAAYNQAKDTLTNALKTKNLAQRDVDEKRKIFSSSQTSHEAIKQQLEAQKVALALAEAQLAQATDNADQAQQLLTNLTAALTQQQEASAQAFQTLNDRQANAITAQAALTQAQQALANAQAQKDQAEQNYSDKTSNEAQARLDLQEAQTNYDTKLIPDPTWTPPTYQKENIRLVPVITTVTETTQSANILPALDHTIWTGAGTGFQNARPTIDGGVLKFSYMQQSVTYTKQENLQGTLTLSVDVKNQDSNRGIQDTYRIELHTYDASGQQNGYAVYNSPTGWHDWTQRQITVDPTSPVASYKVTLTGFDGGYWAGTYGPEMRTPTLSATITTTTTTTTYTYETYYTTEPVLIEGTIQVQINEGGQATYTAPEGAVFTTSNLRYEAKDRPECGIDIKPNLQGNQITISADNGVWGDPCGGWYKHVIGTISYLGQPTAPLIKDPALLPALQEAQAAHDQAVSDLQQSQQVLTQSQQSLAAAEQTSNEANQNSEAANSQLQSAEDLYNTEELKSQALQTSNEAAQQKLDQDQQIKTQAQQELNGKQDLLATATSNEAQAKTQLDLSQANLTSSDEALTQASTNQQEAEESTNNSATAFNSSLEVAKATGSTIPDLIKEANDIFNTPQGSPDVPTNLTAESLQEIDLSTIDPTELSPEQATLLVAAALEAFETAVEGSPEYEQALDALFLAAQQDDIQVDPALEAIPGVGEAAKAVVAIFNIVGNVGADISPEKRKEAQTLVVTTLVVGQIAQAAAMASVSSGSSFRRK